MGKFSYAIGDKFYEASVDDEGKATVDTWIVSTIRKNKVFTIWAVDGLTIEKGKWTSYIPEWMRRSFTIGGFMEGQHNWAKSIPAAIKIGMKRHAEYIKNIDRQDFDSDEEMAAYIKVQEKGMSQLKGRLTKAKK